MAWAADLLLGFHNWWNNINAEKQEIFEQKVDRLKHGADSSSSAEEPFFRMGILSAAAFNYVGIFDPVSKHPSVLITGIAARDKSRAEAQIKVNKRYLAGDVKAYDSYEALLDDKDIDGVYISTPNGLHHKWAIAALEKGKHVLIEKPIASNATEAQEIRDTAARVGKVAVEAFHWRFHPSAYLLKDILDSEEYGKILSLEAKVVFPDILLRKDDIRYQYKLGGGASMDLAYVFNALAFFGCRDFASSDTTFDVLSSKPRLNPKDKFIDDAITAEVRITQPDKQDCAQGHSIAGTVKADMGAPRLFGLIPTIWAAEPAVVTIQTQGAEITYVNFMGAWSGHKIIIVPVARDPKTQVITSRDDRNKTVKTLYIGGRFWDEEMKSEGGGQELWTNYRWQLEGFVRMARNGERGYKGPWMRLEESVRVMDMIDKSYEKAGLPIRGK